MRRKHYFVWMLTVALTAASVMPMTVYAQPAFASGGEVKVVEGDVGGLSKRNDLTVVVRFRYLGKRWRVVVPAGYAVQTLLNQEGYSGFLYLSAVFGAVPEEA